MSGTWVFAVMAGADPVEPRQHLHCTRCGERLVVVLPLKVETFVAVSRGFIDAHRDCPAPTPPEEHPPRATPAGDESR